MCVYVPVCTWNDSSSSSSSLPLHICLFLSVVIWIALCSCKLKKKGSSVAISPCCPLPVFSKMHQLHPNTPQHATVVPKGTIGDVLFSSRLLSTFWSPTLRSAPVPWPPVKPCAGMSPKAQGFLLKDRNIHRLEERSTGGWPNKPQLVC